MKYIFCVWCEFNIRRFVTVVTRFQNYISSLRKVDQNYLDNQKYLEAEWSKVVFLNCSLSTGTERQKASKTKGQREKLTSSIAYIKLDKFKKDVKNNE